MFMHYFLNLIVFLLSHYLQFMMCFPLMLTWELLFLVLVSFTILLNLSRIWEQKSSTRRARTPTLVVPKSRGTSLLSYEKYLVNFSEWSKRRWISNLVYIFGPMIPQNIEIVCRRQVSRHSMQRRANTASWTKKATSVCQNILLTAITSCRGKERPGNVEAVTMILPYRSMRRPISSSFQIPGTRFLICSGAVNVFCKYELVVLLNGLFTRVCRNKLLYIVTNISTDFTLGCGLVAVHASVYQRRNPVNS